MYYKNYFLRMLLTYFNYGINITLGARCCYPMAFPALQGSPGLLFPFYGFKKRFKITFAKRTGAFPLYDLNK